MLAGVRSGDNPSVIAASVYRRIRGLAAMAERPMNQMLFLHGIAEHSAFLDVIHAADLDGFRKDFSRVRPDAGRADRWRRVELAFQPFIKSDLLRYPSVFSLFRLLVVLLRSYRSCELFRTHTCGDI